MRLVLLTLAGILTCTYGEVLGDGVDVASMLPLLQKLNGLASGYNGPDNVKDTVIFGRSIRITDQGLCSRVKDLATSFSSTKCANSSVEATAEASSELFTLLIRLGEISHDELGLKPATPEPKRQACRDNFSAKKCKLHIDMGHCNPSNQFFKWMHINCYKSCGGCLTIKEITGAN
ncbi:uncharacterized protein [Watersipora subatra]|uniref:uncharacterized protein n=1 Tax=Watersipora subatra TaxID=2589382 RepID=UPI00355C23D3